MSRTALRNSFQMESHTLTGAKSSLINSVLRRIFVGQDGIRAGWSALLFVIIYLILNGIETATLGHFVNLEGRGPLTPSLAFVQESFDLLVIAVATWVMARIEHRHVFSYGLTGTYRVLRLASGLACGILCLSILVGILWKLHLLVFDGVSLGGLTAWKYGLAWAGVFLLVGVFEESLLRGYLQYRLAHGIGFWWAAVLLSTAFAVWHISNGGESPLGLVVVGLSGLVFCLSLWYTKSLWWAVGFHSGWDWGQSYLYGTPDSGLLAKGHLLSSHPSGNSLWNGGTTGPEGSCLIVPMLIAMALVMWLWWGRTPASS